MKKILYITTLSRTINAFLVPHIEMLIKEGHKVDAMNRCDKVCLTVWNQGFKKEGHWEWNPTSVVVFGKVKLVTEKNIFEDRLRKLAAKYYPNIDEIEKEMEHSAARAQLFAIKIEHMTGKLVNEK